MKHPVIDIEPTERLKKLPPYLFAEIDRVKRELIAKGKDIIDLGVGDPDIPTPDFIIEVLAKAAKDSANHRYALDQGMPEFRKAIAEWYRRRFNVHLDPNKEILPLIGSKEGIGHIPLALINPGDVALVPDPGYPVYKSGVWFAGGEVSLMPLLQENDFLVDLKAVEEDIPERTKFMFLNYPNNPTAVCAPKDFFKKTVSFAHTHRIIICHDAAYTEVCYDGYRPPSFLETDGAKEIGVEFHSLSKTFNMTGWRVGFVCGNEKVISLLAKVKSNLDSGIFQAIQLAAVEAFKHDETVVKDNVAVYQRRRDILVDGLNALGWNVPKPKATFYVWVPVPSGYTSQELASKLLKDGGLVVTPGNGFGANGEGYIRMSLTVNESRIKEAVARIKKLHEH
ncbi:MAG: LL-diaminopimelate aminotransferase [Omnitrophica bacterium RIFCSPLOWO2_12_FULL_44_17]|uniref:Aminotransferase n=1 Tax=Candidatus Danuiimicrobium aquiferis TaxID=1801832 RepID=A0A1G1L227_9BACT|nr:MAG: LL-diaminopimelate aminotransferase [Omnitrophica bacterium RIFCSPHIGHO2_02_FULL_45_28]OGW91269.1 MAG: LL-diaminopimelate aminotransferase [Omnitrophica bacterium RIFCSPHIGHO2_12_FULL_44_12]OGW99200.1 MAG: LL-diaminopimelate aminotransferase [Omnitrophica bacterium RIFCSPLOWO2_12_FULL_44_17]OGX04384.1 MAG: LL-diaminopimelate aminotransferase [Omnitrophica bacterium RIFCSPLOWO2_02_FULL_44_11]